MDGNLGIGSVVVKDDSVAACGRNLVSSTHDPTAHAEVVPLRESGTALGQADLSGCALYPTFQECPMCCGVIIPSGIVTLVMGARPDPLESRFGAYTVERLIESAGWGDKIEVVTGVLTDACAEIQRDWESRSIGGRWARLV